MIHTYVGNGHDRALKRFNNGVHTFLGETDLGRGGTGGGFLIRVLAVAATTVTTTRLGRLGRLFLLVLDTTLVLLVLERLGGGGGRGRTPLEFATTAHLGAVHGHHGHKGHDGHNGDAELHVTVGFRLPQWLDKRRHGRLRFRNCERMTASGLQAAGAS
jgi:hypothetical protein